jgi:hypothetical protein
VFDRLRYVLKISAACGACLAVGCADEVVESRGGAIPPPAIAPQQQARVTPAPVNVTKAVVTNVTGVMVSEVKAGEDSGAEPEAASKGAAVTDGGFKAPFPDRVDLFVAPKRQGGPAQSSGDNAVELMGFVRVDRQRAVLAINGEIMPLAEGENHFGVEVITVRPPMVVLQRGRQRWQATLE